MYKNLSPLSARVLAMAAVLFWAGASAQGQTVWYVNDDASGNNDGTNWENAFIDLQSALAAPNAGHEIWVATGIYKPTAPDGPRTAAFQLSNGVAVHGGFDGTETSLTERAKLFHQTILSGDLAGDDGPDFTNNGENSYHVLYHAISLDLDATAVLDGFTVTGGNADGSDYLYSGGGGMFNDEGNSPTVHNCTFIDNSARLYGGGVFNRYCEPAFEKCVIIGNRVTTAGVFNYAGGGIHNWHADATLCDCLINGNTAAGYGGGVYNYRFNPTITNSTIVNNSAGLDGGGIYNGNDCVLTATNCILWSNSDSSGAGEFAQLYDAGSSSTVLSYSCVEGCDTFCANPLDQNTGEDPLFADADGIDGIPGTQDDDFHLLDGSPCIDGGDNSAVCGPEDLDGNPRIVDGDGDGLAVVDMGAYERAGADGPYLDIKPGSCPNPFNRKSHGVLPVALVGTDSFDATTVDISSITLSRVDGIGGTVAPNEGPPGPHSVIEDVATPFDGDLCECHDLAGDGVFDLMMHFRSDEVVEALELDGSPSGAAVELMLEGTLTDGTPFSAADCIILVPPQALRASLILDSNGAGASVDIESLDLLSGSDGARALEQVYPTD